MMGKQQPEFALQCRVVDELDKLPFVAFYHHSPNGSKLHGSQNQRARTGARLKRSGTQSGYPDLLLYFQDGSIAHFELKANKNTLTDTQVNVRERLEELGHRYAVIRHTDDMFAAFKEWGWMA